MTFSTSFAGLRRKGSHETRSALAVAASERTHLIRIVTFSLLHWIALPQQVGASLLDLRGCVCDDDRAALPLLPARVAFQWVPV